MNFQAPAIQYGEVLPILIVLGGALLGVLVEAFLPRAKRYAFQVTISLGSIVAAFIAVVRLHGTSNVAAEGSVVVDGPTLFLQGTILLLAIGGVLLIAERGLDSGGSAFAAQAAAIPGSEAERTALTAGLIQTEVFPLTLFALGGALLFPAAGDLVTMFVALEVLSLPLYLMSGLARRRRLLSQEAALKYFLLGAFSSAFFLYGSALIYGYAGTVSLGGIRQAISSNAGNDTILLLGVALVTVGLLFKVSAVPFHAWTPDVYQGAPTPVTAFMAAVTKVAAFGAILRLFYVGLSGLRWDWRPMLTGIAIVTMVLGAILALTQTDIKRMLAYSSIAHAGFILTGVVAANKAGLEGSLVYLVAYGFTTIGAFAIVTLVRDSTGEATHLSQWSGLARRSPLIASTFALFLLALAGIPLTSGFVAKFAVFSAAYSSGSTALVIVGVLSSAIAAFFYVRVIVLMFFSEPKEDGPTVVLPPVMTTAAITLAAAVTLVLGILPSAVLDLAKSAAQFTF
ncbi:NADH-quinone oxidoreductase subunit N [mine drainage metagenome]|uniref:NADH-quinone oxidoreductase subunit N n=1 Tax=mine drainage metagenome TaxID=410659 RepID=A0A1J5QJ27_9ZZZZ